MSRKGSRSKGKRASTSLRSGSIITSSIVNAKIRNTAGGGIIRKCGERSTMITAYIYCVYKVRSSFPTKEGKEGNPGFTLESFTRYSLRP